MPRTGKKARLAVAVVLPVEVDDSRDDSSASLYLLRCSNHNTDI